MQGQEFATRMRVLELGSYDGVLGMDWLSQFSPMNCHWLHKTLSFQHKGELVTLQGIKLGEPTKLLKVHGFPHAWFW